MRVVAVVVLVAAVAPLLGTNAAPPRAEAEVPGGLTCRTGEAYMLRQTSAGVFQLQRVSLTSGATTTITTAPIPAPAEMNALGISADGATAWMIARNGSTTPATFTVRRLNVVTGGWSNFPITLPAPAPNSVVRGALNHATGIYYFSSPNGSDTSQQFVYAFNTNTNTFIGRVGWTVNPAGSFGNGDLVFDSYGNMYLVASQTSGPAHIYRVNREAIPTVPTPSPLPQTLIATIASPGMGVSFPGLTFDNDGWLYAGTQTNLYRINPTTGSVVGLAVPISGATTSLAQADLSDCSEAPTLRLFKDFSRLQSTDQVRLTINPGVAPGNTIDTTGTTTGVQTARVGHLPVVVGQTYTLIETQLATTVLNNYSVALRCVDVANGNAPVTLIPGSTTGTTRSSSIVIPPIPLGGDAPQVDCTYTNRAHPQLTLSKALDGDRAQPGDQFTMEMRNGSLAGSVVGTTASATSTGTGSTITAGTGTTTLTPATAGTTYYLTEVAAGGTDLTSYSKTISCVDTAGLMTGPFPNGGVTGTVASPGPVAFDPAVGHAVTPVGGAVIACTLTNQAQVPSISVAKSLTSSTPGPGGTYTVVYSVEVTNSGTGPGTYSLADTLRPGDGAVFQSAGWTGPGGSSGSFTGIDTATTLATNQTLSNLAGQNVHTYTVTAVYGVDAAEVTAGPAPLPTSNGCLADEDDTTLNFGFRNVATLTVGGTDTSDDACAPFDWPRGSLSLSKVIVDADPDDDLGDAVVFPVTVSCTGPGLAPAVTQNVTVNRDGTPTVVSNLIVGSSCDIDETDTDGGVSSIDPSGPVTVTSGAPVEVVITNTYPGSATTLTLVKVVGNTHGGAAGPDDFTLTATPTSPAGPTLDFASGDTQGVVAGVFEIGEVPLAGYALTDIECEADGATPAPLDLDDPTITVATGEAWTCTLTNADQPGSVSWEKVDADDTSVALAGSEWQIVGPAPTTTVLAVTDCVALPCAGPDTDPSPGAFSVEGLAWGTYTVAETKAPPGFVLDTTAWPFTVSAADLDHAFVDPFENAKQDTPLIPLTGGMGEHQFFLVGSGLMAGVALLIAVRRRRRDDLPPAGHGPGARTS